VLLDVNVLVYAQRADAEHHSAYREWLSDALVGPEPVLVTADTLVAAIRIVTHPRIWRPPTTRDAAHAFVASVVAAPACEVLDTGVGHWPTFERCCITSDARGNDLPDAWLAAIALDHGVDIVTADRGFRRFRGLRVRDPLAAT
jgi:uncharacterized protein